MGFINKSFHRQFFMITLVVPQLTETRHTLHFMPKQTRMSQIKNRKLEILNHFWRRCLHSS